MSKLSKKEAKLHQDALFREQTGLALEPNCGIDTSIYRDEWHGTSPQVEIVCCDFYETALKPWQPGWR